MITVENALVISSVSLGISITGLFWNIYKEVFLRPRSKIRGDICIIKNTEMETVKFVHIGIINFGPGKLVINGIVFKESSILKRILFKTKQGIIIHDYTNILNKPFPVNIEQYDSADQYLVFNSSKWLESPITHLGFADNLGRYHWIKKSQLRKMKNEYRKLNNKEKEDPKNNKAPSDKTAWRISQ